MTILTRWLRRQRVMTRDVTRHDARPARQYLVRLVPTAAASSVCPITSPRLTAAATRRAARHGRPSFETASSGPAAGSPLTARTPLSGHGSRASWQDGWMRWPPSAVANAKTEPTGNGNDLITWITSLFTECTCFLYHVTCPSLCLLATREQWRRKRYGRYGGRYTNLKFGMAAPYHHPMNSGQLIL